MTHELTAAEQAAIEIWTQGSSDTTQMLLAVRAALTVQRKEIADALQQEAVDRAKSSLVSVDIPHTYQQASVFVRRYGLES